MQRRLRRLRPVERGRRDIQPTHGTRKTGRSTQRPDPAALVHRQRRSHNLDHAGRRGQRRHPVQGGRQYRTQRHRRHEGRRLLGTDPRYERGERRTLLDDYRRRKHRFSERHRRLENPRCGAYSRNGRRSRGLLDPQRPAIDRCVGKPGESRRKADVAHHRNLARRQRQRHLHAGRRIDRIRTDIRRLQHRLQDRRHRLRRRVHRRRRFAATHDRLRDHGRKGRRSDPENSALRAARGRSRHLGRNRRRNLRNAFRRRMLRPDALRPARERADPHGASGVGERQTRILRYQNRGRPARIRPGRKYGAQL